jgi:dihydrofolate reductase
MVIMIAAIDSQRALGKAGKLLCHLPLDLTHFKQHTVHQSILMGRKTFESIGRALPNRENFELTRQENVQIQGCRCVHSLQEALVTRQDESLWVIGGAEIYAQAAPLATTAVVTEIDKPFDGDAFAPELGPHWSEVARQSHTAVNGLPFSFVTYQHHL